MANIPPVHVKLVPYRVGTSEGFRPVPDRLTTLDEDGDRWVQIAAKRVALDSSAAARVSNGIPRNAAR